MSLDTAPRPSPAADRRGAGAPPRPEPDAGRDAGPGRPDPSPHRAARAALLADLRHRRRELRALLGWSLLEAVPAMLSGLVVARAVDDGFLTGRPLVGLAWLGVLALTAVVGAWGTRQTLARLADVVEPFRDDLVRRVVDAALRPAPGPGPAPQAHVARLTQQVEILREAYAAVLTAVQQFLVVAVGALVGLLALAPGLLLLVAPPLVLGVAVLARALPRLAAAQRASVLAEERLSAGASGLAEAMRDIVACGGEELVAGRVGDSIDAQAAATRRLSRRTAALTAAVATCGWLPVVLVLGVGPVLLGDGLTAGVLLGAVAYAVQGLQPALQALVDGLSGPGLWLLTTMRRIVETTSEPAPDGGRVVAVGPPPATAGGPAVELIGVDFRYSPDADPVVHDLDLRIEDGDHLAVVGSSGVGKSTLAGLIAGLQVPQQGTVRLAGRPPAASASGALAAARAYLPQEAYLVDGTVRDNLTYLAPDVEDPAIATALARLGAEALVTRLGGLAAPLEPDAVSAGEAQLIVLVRAYLSPAPLVILDEATCHLDPVAERRVEREFATRPGTLIVIAHRMSSALRARRVLVMDGARTQVGEHEELMTASPLYRDLIGHWGTDGAPGDPGAGHRRGAKG